MRSFLITSRTTWALNSSEYFAAGMGSTLSTHGKKNSPCPRNTTHSPPLDLLNSEQDRIRASLDQISTRLDNLTDTYADARTGLDQLTELLVNLDDLYNKCEPAERRILNPALFTRITIDDEENATYTPDKTTASVLAHTSIDALSEVTAETSLPRQFPGGADLRGGGARGIRTPDLLIANETRYQLRHSPECGPILAPPQAVLASLVAVSPPTAPESPGDGPREFARYSPAARRPSRMASRSMGWKSSSSSSTGAGM